MKRLLSPDYYVTSIYRIDFTKLKEKGIENVLIDIDNTLMPWGSKDADRRVRDLVGELKKHGFKVCILSNSSRERVKRFVGDMGIEFSSFGRKPMRMTFYKAIKKLGGEPQNTCIIGDQIFTDILGGNRVGIYTILVDPIEKREFAGTKWLRRIEHNIRRKLKYAGEISREEEKNKDL